MHPWALIGPDTLTILMQAFVFALFSIPMNWPHDPPTPAPSSRLYSMMIDSADDASNSPPIT
jgi:hypothetical protein